jgi:hypothetical protein
MFSGKAAVYHISFVTAAPIVLPGISETSKRRSIDTRVTKGGQKGANEKRHK